MYICAAVLVHCIRATLASAFYDLGIKKQSLKLLIQTPSLSVVDEKNRIIEVRPYDEHKVTGRLTGYPRVRNSAIPRLCPPEFSAVGRVANNLETVCENHRRGERIAPGQDSYISFF